MALTITQNSNAISTLNNINENRKAEDEKLASGTRINRASDDAAGLQITERLTTEINEAEQRSVNVQDQINQNNTTETGLTAINENLQRANQLSIQSANGRNDNSAIQQELDQITEQVNLLAEEVLGSGGFVSGLDANDPQATQQAISDALTTITQSNSNLGANSNTLASLGSTYQTAQVNTTQGRSTIEDTDYGAVTSSEQRNQLLLQTAITNKKDEETRKGLLVNQLV
ncbi:flagellin [Thalassotalea ganghwensis]